jgi:predicted alpha/beta superfamily hydrolase
MTTLPHHGLLISDGRVDSLFLDGPLTIRIYLAPSYLSSPRRRYPVLYLHDGQNVFSPAVQECCYGWGNWELDKTVDRLVAEGRMQEIIMVGIDNSRSRYRELRGRLYPETKATRKAPRSANALDNNRFDAYASFLTKELKPKIDRQFRTLKTATNTGLMGSSLGGIASLALAWEYPKTFGRAASLSGSFNIEKRNFVERALRNRTRGTKPIRVYLDSGTIDDSGDDDDRRHTDAVADELRRLGWKDDRNLLRFTDARPLTDHELRTSGLREDKWYEAARSQHNEFYWRRRAWRPLVFLFPAK